MRAQDAGLRIELRGRSATTALIIGHAYFGAGWAFGPPRLMSAGGFLYALQLWPQHAWGWVLLIGAVLTAVAPWCNWLISAVLHILASVPLVALAATLGLAELARVSEGWGGTVLYLVPVVGHAVLVLARYRYWRQSAS